MVVLQADSLAPHTVEMALKYLEALVVFGGYGGWNAGGGRWFPGSNRIDFESISKSGIVYAQSGCGMPHQKVARVCQISRLGDANHRGSRI